MYTCPIQLSDVRYNAATQNFEASVTVHDNATVRRYACAIPAPISMSFTEAAEGLTRQAVRRHQQRGGLFSEVGRASGTLRSDRSSRAPMRWLQQLIRTPRQNAA